MLHSTNYINTLITPSPDCGAPRAEAPNKAGTIAAQQYELINSAPYMHSSDDVIVTTQANRKEIPDDERDLFREVYFSKGQACLRASPLVKTYGWAIHHDSDAHVALVDPASSRFAVLLADTAVTKIPGMRNRRA